MIVATTWILFNLHAPWWVWVLFSISALIHELDAFLRLLDRFKRS